MSLLEQASLVITPNAVKESKLYSVVPSDGSGDMNVVRATTATRVNSAGLIEVVPRNLLTYSEEFDNAYWVKRRITIVQNSIIAPDGNLTAYKLIDDTTASATHQISRSVSVASGAHTMSVFAKKGEYNFIRFWEDSQTGRQAFFNLDTGVATNVNTDSVSIVDFGNGWYRCIATINIPSAGNFGFRINLTPNGTTTAYNGTGTNGVFLWGAQLEQGSIATEYFPTTTRLNIPRIDYTNGSCPSLLVEPQRTNLALYSEEFNSAYWTKTGLTIIANNTTSPDGNLTADKIVGNASAGDKIAFRILLINANQAFTISAFFKKSEYKLAFLRAGGQDGQPYVIYNLDTQSIVSTSGATSTKIEDYNNGWYRVSLTLNLSSGTLLAPNVSFAPDSGYTLTANNVLQYTGDDISGGFIWGFQVEANGAAYATSYIPTVASAVTRNDDVISKTGISDLINGTEGTLFIEASSLANDGTTKYFSINNGTTSNEIVFQFTSTNNTVGIRYIVGGIPQVDASYTILNTLQFNKFAYTWQLNKFELWHNSNKIISDTLGNVATEFNRIEFKRANGTIPFYSNVKQVQLYKTALTDQECINLTTL